MTTPLAPDPEQLAAFDRDGLLILRGALDPKVRDRAAEAAGRLLATDRTSGRDRSVDGKDGFRGVVALDDAFLPLVANPAVLPTPIALLSPNIHLLSSNLISMPSLPDEQRTIRVPSRHGWHRDMSSTVTDLGVEYTPHLAIKVAYFLTAPGPDAGLTMFVPGSHTRTGPVTVPQGDIDPPGAITPDIGPYDVVLFENRTWHAGGLNRSGHERLAVMMQYGFRWLNAVDDPDPSPSSTGRAWTPSSGSSPAPATATPTAPPPARAPARAPRRLVAAPDRRPGSSAGPPTPTAPPRETGPVASSTPSDPPGERFASTVPYYAAFRPRYAPEFYTLLAERFGLDGTRRALDLGAGPGTLALDLAPLVGEVIAVDPEKGMLEEGRRLAAEHGITNITWREGDSTTLPALSIGPVLLTVMGAAYHWMDRDRVARDLDRIIEPGGAIALASRGAPGGLEPAPWRQVVDEVRTRYLGPERRAGSGTRSHPEERHQDVLARSPFSRVDTARWDHTLTRTVDEVLGWVFSLSYASPARLGEKKDAFEQDLRAALLAVAPSGRFDEVIHTEAVIATRP